MSSTTTTIAIFSEWETVLSAADLRKFSRDAYIGSLLDCMMRSKPSRITEVIIGSSAVEVRMAEVHALTTAKGTPLCIIARRNDSCIAYLRKILTEISRLRGSRVPCTALGTFGSLKLSFVAPAQVAAPLTVTATMASIVANSQAAQAQSPMSQRYALTAAIVSDLAITSRSYVVFTDGSAHEQAGSYAAYFAHGTAGKLAKFGRIAVPEITQAERDAEIAFNGVAPTAGCKTVESSDMENVCDDVMAQLTNTPATAPEVSVVKQTHRRPTNIRAEGTAIIVAFAHLLDHLDSWDDALIVTDCKFWIDMLLSHMPNWSVGKFAGKKNPDLTARIWNQWSSFPALGKTVRLRHVYSHGKHVSRASPPLHGSTDHYCRAHNEIVDLLASYARKNMAPDEQVSGLAAEVLLTSKKRRFPCVKPAGTS